MQQERTNSNVIENPVPWPNGARCAVAFTFDVDSDSEFQHMNRDTAANNVSTLSWLRYDRVAVPRIVKLYERYNLKQTFFVPGWTAEKYPELVECIVGGGHEIAHHGYLHERPNAMTPDEEEYWFRRATDALVKTTGVRPRGYRSPFYGFSKHTADLLAQEGFTYDSSLMGDDVPYLIRSKSGELIELPVDWSMDDWPQYVINPDLDFTMQPQSPDRAMEVFQAQFDAAWNYGGLWVTVWHPFVSGRLARLARVEKLIEYMMQKGQVWFATLDEISAYTRKLIDDGSWTPNSEQLPQYTGVIPELRSDALTEGRQSQ
ncbi:polysaccharide deacetylase family protein [Nocardioides taihuensis]|uniref:Polysaccharide deacetylase n=1 Tax=Nocardioides taihuensis TaxID=1835606 RepID=A0ABW0BEJ5_9ACTN